MRWERESVFGKLDREKKWSLWFAWHPVTINPTQAPTEQVVWLEKVYRRRVFGRMCSWWDYSLNDKPVSS